MQTYWVGHGHSARQICLPSANVEVVHGVRWGRGDMLDTPAYWALRCATEENPLHGFSSQGGSLIEEIGFCLLGGFGITAELNSAAFDRLRERGVFDLAVKVSEDQIRELLLLPLTIGYKHRRYRFPNQRAARLAAMRRVIGTLNIDALPVAEVVRILRRIEGIGPKTAAWIVRNHYGSDHVAILDIHVIRACSRLRLFPDKVSLPRDYEQLQDRFLSFARAIEVRPAILDAVMWIEMRSENRSVRPLAA